MLHMLHSCSTCQQSRSPCGVMLVRFALHESFLGYGSDRSWHLFSKHRPPKCYTRRHTLIAYERCRHVLLQSPISKTRNVWNVCYRFGLGMSLFVCLHHHINHWSHCMIYRCLAGARRLAEWMHAACDPLGDAELGKLLNHKSREFC